jgi:hypothetical protein
MIRPLWVRRWGRDQHLDHAVNLSNLQAWQRAGCSRRMVAEQLASRAKDALWQGQSSRVAAGVECEPTGQVGARTGYRAQVATAACHTSDHGAEIEP